MSKRWDIPVQSFALMLSESDVLNHGRTISMLGRTKTVDDFDWEFIDNPVTWLLLFGWVPDHVRELR
jgi:hypothetical protein